jgi:uncharacterized protein
MPRLPALPTLPAIVPPARRAPRADRSAAEAPWWRHAMVWLVIAGPLAALLAGSVTLWIAWVNADTVVVAPVSGTVHVPNRAADPAQAARNHVATPQR